MRRIYNNRDLLENKKEGGERKKRGKGSWETRGAGNSHPRMRSLFSLGRRVV